MTMHQSHPAPPSRLQMGNPNSMLNFVHRILTSSNRKRDRKPNLYAMDLTSNSANSSTREVNDIGCPIVPQNTTSTTDREQLVTDVLASVNSNSKLFDYNEGSEQNSVKKKRQEASGLVARLSTITEKDER